MPEPWHDALVGAGFMPALGRKSLRWAGMKPAPTLAIGNYLAEAGTANVGSATGLKRDRVTISRTTWILRQFQMPVPLAISSDGMCEIATGCRPRNDMPGNLCSHLRCNYSLTWWKAEF